VRIHHQNSGNSLPVRPFVNPHPAPCRCRLAQVTDETLRTLIELRRGDTVGNGRLDAAGVPAVNTLVAELLRRESAAVAVQR
jgi:hypothetical protein